LGLGYWDWGNGTGILGLGYWDWDIGTGVLELGYWNWDIGIGILVRLEGFRGEEVCGTRITDGIVEGFDRTAGHKGRKDKGRINIAVCGRCWSWVWKVQSREGKLGRP
jgi:hypothetical protein